MALKADQQNDSGATKRFRLLFLKHEMQADAKVLKAVVDEVDVLRLCYSLGMATSDERDTSRMHKFEFGLFNSSDYDDDFARFIREKIFAGPDLSLEGEDQLDVGCLFGKQDQVKAQLSRMGLLDADHGIDLCPRDQGVYCIERTNGGGRCCQFVVFTWLDSGLFGPECIRDIPTLMLRFLLSLSSSITCCLSREDFQRIQGEVNVATTSTNNRQNSFSVAFRVQKQVEQSDSITCGVSSSTSIPHADEIKSLDFIAGVFPAVAVESRIPSTKEWHEHTDIVSSDTFEEWISEKHARYVIQLPPGQYCPPGMRDRVLAMFDSYPCAKLHESEKNIYKILEETKAQIDDDVFRATHQTVSSMVRDADVLFAVRNPTNSSRMDRAFEKYNKLQQHFGDYGVLRQLDGLARTLFYMPERLQTNMMLLNNVFMRRRSAFDEVLDTVVNSDTPIDSNGGGNILHIMEDTARNAFNWLVNRKSEFHRGFCYAMKQRQARLQRIWVDLINDAIPTLCVATREEKYDQCENKLKTLLYEQQENIKDTAFRNLRKHLASCDDQLPSANFNRLTLTSDAAAIKVNWVEKVEKEPSKVIYVYQLNGVNSVQASLMGVIEFEAGFELLALASVKQCKLVAILVNDNRTIVRRIQFTPEFLSSEQHKAAKQAVVRIFPRLCSFCSVRAHDRRVAFTFEGNTECFGSVAICRFNETFTSIAPTHRVDMDAVFRLAPPLVDMILTERSLCVVDVNGDMQSYDTRSHQTSKKLSLGDTDSMARNATWVSGLLSFADELVVGRASIEQGERLAVCSVSSEDHHKLPAVILCSDVTSENLAVYSMGDVIYIFDVWRGTVATTELKVTVRSDAYRIQRSWGGGKDAKSRPLRCLQSEGQTKSDTAKHWLRVFYHVFEKFSVRSLIENDANRGDSFGFALEVVVVESIDDCSYPATGDLFAVAKGYFHSVMVDLLRLNKPLFGLNLEENVSCQNANNSFRPKAMRRVLTTIISFLPVQICRAEDNMLKVMRDGENATSNLSEQNDSATTEASEIAQSLRFGLLSPFLESWGGRCSVVTSMGKQSTGKSYFLNHLTGTSFAISGSRCTDGAWMSLRVLSPDMLLVVLDFEGLGSFERSEQEDIFLSVLNASVSLFTVFRMESRFDKDIDGLFSRFQKGVQLIKNDTRLFRGLLYMSVKDVNMNDQQGVIDELVTKLDGIFEANRDQNFLTEMYSGKLEVNCSPPFGTVEYYQSMENDAAKTLRDIIAPSEDVVAGFSTGKAFLDCLRIVLAKISILDWTSMDKSTHNLLIADVEQRLPGILRTGCQVPRPLLAEAIIPSHLKEDVLEFGSREKLVITLKEVCQEYPYFAPKWTTLNEQVNLDNVRDDAFDVGFDVTDPQNKKFGTIQKTLVVQFQQFLALQNKVYGNSKLTADDHKSYDDYLTFVVCRRKVKASRWLRGFLDGRMPDTLSRFGCRAANTNALPVISDVCTQLRMRQILATTVLRIMLAVVSVNTLNVAMKITRLEFHRVLEVQAMKGNANARKGNTPVDNRVLLLAPNCDHNCSLLADHFGDHRCSVLMHVCGVACSASTCVATCLLDIQREHTVHKCAEMQCLQPCLMNGCKSNCGVKNHFHGQMIESCAFAKENGLHEAFDEDVDMPDNDSMTTVTHMCLGSHACAEVCSIDGICEQKVHLKKSSRTYNGARGTFEYVFQEMNGCKKQCAQILPCGSQDHGDLEHSCAPQGRENGTEDEEQRQEAIHYCAVRCPSCDYYCNKEFGHMGLHTTSHGNMRQTYFMAKSNDIDIEDRKYRVGERGTAEMCNLFCTKIGRGHTHYLPCDSRNGKNCTAVASKDRRRHCVDELYPPPDKGMDELLHVQFWATIGWEDPCTEEERALFAKCPFKCNAPEHEDEGKVPSHCVLDAWHQPELKPEMSGDGFAYVDGHKFECVHAVDTGKFHNIFVLDSSGSMSGQPWQNLLCACNEFVLNRHQDGGANDLVSYITFDHRSYIRCEAQPLGDTLQMVLPYSGGGTRFTEGLRAANEVLSRNKFEEFQVVLIFFSDGRPCDIELAMTIAKHTRLSYAKYDVKSFVVGFGRMDLAVLKRVAVEMGGEYRQVLDTDALKTELQRISAILCNSEASLALANPTTGPGYLERGQSKRARI